MIVVGGGAVPLNCLLDWLGPMLDEALAKGVSSRELAALITTAAAAPWNPGDMGVNELRVPWIRLGQLLRDRLDWPHYPDYPALSAPTD